MALSQYDAMRRQREQLNTEQTDQAIKNAYEAGVRQAKTVGNSLAGFGRNIIDSLPGRTGGLANRGADATVPDPRKTKKVQDKKVQEEMAGRLSEQKDEMPTGIGGKDASMTPALSEKEPTAQEEVAARTAKPAGVTGQPATVPEKPEGAKPPFNNAPDRVTGGQVLLTNNPLHGAGPEGMALGDVATHRNRVQQGIQGQPLQAGNLDVQFDPSVSPEARAAFMAQPSKPAPGGSTGGLLAGPAPTGPYPRVTGPDPYGHKAKAAGGMPQLFTKETHPNMRYDEMETLNKQLLANAGALGTRSLTNQGLANVAEIGNRGDLEEQALRNQGALEAAGLRSAAGGNELDVQKLSGGTDDKGRANPQVGVYKDPETGEMKFLNTKYQFLSPDFDPYNPNPRDVAELQRIQKEDPKLYDQIMTDYGRAGEDEGMFSRLGSWLKDFTGIGN